jgi:hypothetical protein
MSPFRRMTRLATGLALTASTVHARPAPHRVNARDHGSTVAQRPEDVAAKTMEAMALIGQALARYTLEHDSFPSMAELNDPHSEFFENHALGEFVLRDAWGHGMSVETYESEARLRRDGPCKCYDAFRVVSAGADGVFVPTTWTHHGPNGRKEDDLVLTFDEGWVRWYPAKLTYVVASCMNSDWQWPAEFANHEP